jgi:hypothetical protein
MAAGRAIALDRWPDFEFSRRFPLSAVDEAKKQASSHGTVQDARISHGNAGNPCMASAADTRRGPKTS